MSSRKNIGLKTLLIMSTALTVTEGAMAQDGASGEGAFGLDEIVVTARKREEGLMQAPVAVTAVTGKAMDRVGATTLEQIATGVPGLQLGRAAQTTNVYIRGIGSGINKSFEQSVGMYIDGVYMPRSRMYSQAFLDLQQVEILRGPQGILFGKNTVAGAIKVESYTPRPGDDFTGYASFDYEPALNTKRATAAATVPLGEDWVMRLAGRYEDTDGYVHNEIFDKDGQRRQSWLGRVTLAGDITENLSAVAKVAHTDMSGDGIEAVVGVFDPSLGAGLPTSATVGALFYGLVPGFAPADGTAVGFWDSFIGNTRYGEDKETTEATVGSLKLEYAAEKFTITSVTGYSDFDFGQRHDVDFGPINLVHNNEGEKLKQWSEELRVATDFDGPVNLLAGAYYETQDLSIRTDTFLDGEIGGFAGASGAFGPFDSLFDGLLFPTIAGPAVLNCAASADPVACQGQAALIAAGVPNQTGRAPTFDQDAETYAFFGEVTIELTDTLRLDVGGRYSHETKDAAKSVALFINDDPAQIFMNSNGAPTGLLDPLTSVLLAGVWGSSFGTFPHDQQISISESHFDPQARVSWDATDNTMVYVSYSEGYKSGGVNFSPDTANPDGTPGAGTTFEPESVKAWEFGLRSTLVDDRLRLALTAFNSDFSNLQVTSFQGVTFAVGNAAESRTRGVELETQYQASGNLQLGASVAYLDAEYKSFTGAGCTIAQQAAAALAGLAGCQQDLSGRTTPFAPKWSGKFYVDSNFPLGNSLELDARVDVNFKSSHFISLELDPTARQDGYAKIDARVSIGQIDDIGWELAVYGRNLTDKATYTFQVNNPLSAGAFSRWIEEPRVIGVQGRYSF